MESIICVLSLIQLLSNHGVLQYHFEYRCIKWRFQSDFCQCSHHCIYHLFIGQKISPHQYICGKHIKLSCLHKKFSTDLYHQLRYIWQKRKIVLTLVPLLDFMYLLQEKKKIHDYEILLQTGSLQKKVAWKKLCLKNRCAK